MIHLLVIKPIEYHHVMDLVPTRILKGARLRCRATRFKIVSYPNCNHRTNLAWPIRRHISNEVSTHADGSEDVDQIVLSVFVDGIAGTIVGLSAKSGHIIAY